ncbi:MAG: hypothetical protein BroJett013_02340 [Alphaproteobacteria bacterium]|nr:MAG: hypothetical protein BroJett013_02340 [Alphaproteobacteria bacterium]
MAMRPPKKPAKAKAKPAPKDTRPQRERFEEAARKAGVDETGEAFERAMGRLLPEKRPQRPRKDA